MRIQFLPQYVHVFQWEGDLAPFVDYCDRMETAPVGTNCRSANTRVLDELQALEEWITDCLKQVCKEEGYEFDLTITQSWFNKSEKGATHHAHFHLNSFLSGIFYVTESNASTWMNTKSIWPEPGKNFPSLQGETTQTLASPLPTEPGWLLIFPSHLVHSVDAHEGEKPRYTLSFNTFPVGSFGDAAMLTELKTDVTA